MTPLFSLIHAWPSSPTRFCIFFPHFRNMTMPPTNRVPLLCMVTLFMSYNAESYNTPIPLYSHHRCRSFHTPFIFVAWFVAQFCHSTRCRITLKCELPLTAKYGDDVKNICRGTAGHFNLSDPFSISCQALVPLFMPMNPSISLLMWGFLWLCGEMVEKYQPYSCWWF